LIGLKRDISAIGYRISIGIRANVQVTIAPTPNAMRMAMMVMIIPTDTIAYRRLTNSQKYSAVGWRNF
jgi:hypothetical protein